MKNKSNLNFTLAGIAVLMTGCNQKNENVSSEKPNFVVIMADDVSAVDFSCYGSTEYNTPNIDKMAESGVLFNVCWSTALSMPSRVQLMTGRFPTSTGWYGNDFKPMGNDIFNIPGDPGYHLSNELMFSKLLRDNGYKTAIAGKWHVEDTPDWSTFREDYGFDEYCLWGLPDSMPPGYEDYERVKGASGPYWDIGGRGPFWQPAIIENGNLGPTGEEDYGPDYFTSFIKKFISENKKGPFLAYYPMTLAHSWWYSPVSEKTRWSTFGPVPELDSLGNKTGKKTPVGHQYAVEYLDHLVGMIMNHLDSLELSKNTVIIFTTDNGSPGKGKGFLKHENGIRVPLIVHCPDKFKKGIMTNSFAQLADIFPSITEMAGIGVPDSVKLDGVSFVPSLKNDTVRVRNKLYSYVNYKTAYRYDDYFLNSEDELFYCQMNSSGKIDYQLIHDSVSNPELDKVREELAILEAMYPAPDTTNNPKYERFKKVNEEFVNMINKITK